MSMHDARSNDNGKTGEPSELILCYRTCALAGKAQTGTAEETKKAASHLAKCSCSLPKLAKLALLPLKRDSSLRDDFSAA